MAKKPQQKISPGLGKHSELLKLTDDPLSYAKEQVIKYNQEAKINNQVSFELKINFSEKLKASADAVSSSSRRNIGYFFLQQLYHDLDISIPWADVLLLLRSPLRSSPTS